MEFTIPASLDELLQRDHTLNGAVHSTLAHFIPWIGRNHTPLFPEYTDHGVEHLEKVLTTASALIREEAWGIITSQERRCWSSLPCCTTRRCI